MATLGDVDREAVWASFMQTPMMGELFEYLKTELRSAVNAVDGWVDANQVSFNSSLPNPFKSSATSTQKARLFTWVLDRRYKINPTTVLGDVDREAIWSSFMSTPDVGEVFSYLKEDLRAAVNAVDDWIDANQASYNSALPDPFKSVATKQQKARLLKWVVNRRYITGV
jgi:hypothetical protein